MRPAGFRAAGELIAAAAVRRGAEAVGGPVMAAIPLACAAIAVPGGEGLVGFFVRKETKGARDAAMVEGPVEPGAHGCWWSRTRSPPAARRSPRSSGSASSGLEIVGALAVVDRLAGGAEAIAAAAGAPFEALTTIDDVYPERPDR